MESGALFIAAHPILASAISTLPACSATIWLERHLNTACGTNMLRHSMALPACNAKNLPEDPAARVLTPIASLQGSSNNRESWSDCR